MKYLQKTFVSTPPTDAYRKGYDVIKWGTKKTPRKKDKKK